ncbi:hypothetical protein RMCBS344292_18625 [Rhizopus microsporus]|nr:hypothetical protein RMCBS344292_18625 [Rhizopus microsporus]
MDRDSARTLLDKEPNSQAIDLLPFYNNNAEYNSVTSYLEGEVNLKLKQFSYKDIRLNKASNKPLAYVKDILDAYSNGDDISEVTSGAEDELKECLENMCKKIISPRSRIHQRSEASSLNQYLMPLY